jgi:hypothetical protein
MRKRKKKKAAVWCHSITLPPFLLPTREEKCMATYAETLASYETARDDVLVNGYAVSMDGREWRRDNLEALERLIDKYRVLVANSSKFNIFDRARFGAPYRG